MMTGLSILAGLTLICYIIYRDECKRDEIKKENPWREADEAVEWVKNYLAQEASKNNAQ